MVLVNKFVKYDMVHTLKNELNLLYFDKFNYKNIFNNEFKCKIVLQFQLQNLLSIDINNGIIGSFFLLKLFVEKNKRKPYILKVRCIQTFNKKNYVVIIRLDLNKLFELNNFFNYFSLFLLPKLSNDDYIIKELFNNSKNILCNNNLYIRKYIIYNLNHIRIVETNSIFYKWKENLFIDICIINNRVPISILKSKLKSDIFFLKLLR